MAKTKEERKAERKQKVLIIMMFVVAASMLFSGIYYINIGGSQAPGTGEDVTAKLGLIEQYNLRQVTNGTVLVRVDELRNELIAIPTSRCMTVDNIIELRNSSIEGVDVISCEIANPESDPRFTIMCGTFIMFKFMLNISDSEALGRVRSALDNALDEYFMLRSYIIRIQESGLGVNEIYVVGSEETKPGDYVRISLFSRELLLGGTGLLGLESRNVPSGPNFHAEVVNITGISVTGVAEDGFDPDGIMEALNINETEFNSRLPEFRVNGSVAEIGSIDANVQESDNTTTISFSTSRKEIEDIIRRKTLNYSFEPGSVFFQTGLDSNLSNIESLLTGKGIGNVTFRKTGLVSVPVEIIVNDMLVPIENNDAFGASLYMDTEVGDEINISISTITFGQQVIPFGASEVRNETGS